MRTLESMSVDVEEGTVATLRELLPMVPFVLGQSVVIEIDMTRTKLAMAARARVLSSDEAEDGEQVSTIHEMSVSSALDALESAKEVRFDNAETRAIDFDASRRVQKASADAAAEAVAEAQALEASEEAEATTLAAAEAAEITAQAAAEEAEAAAVAAAAKADALKAVAVAAKARPRLTPRDRKSKAVNVTPSDDESEKAVLTMCKKASEMTPEFVTLLSDNNLGAFADHLRKVGIVNVAILTEYTLEELQEALQAPAAKGAKFKLAGPPRRNFEKLGVGGDAVQATVTGGAVTKRAGNGESAKVAAVASRVTSGSVTAASVDFADDSATDDEDASQPVMAIKRAQPSADKFEIDAAELPLMLRLFGAEAVLSYDLICNAVQIVADMLNVKAFPYEPATKDTAAARLETMLEVASEKGLLGDLAAVPKSKPRTTLKWLEKVVISKGTTETSTAGDLDANMMFRSTAGAVLEASRSGKVSEADRKIIDELSASNKRNERVAEDPAAMQVLSLTAAAMQGGETCAAKVQQFGAAVAANPKVAELLYSANVRDPTGARALEHGGQLRVAAEHWRDVRGGLLAAVRAEIRDMLPANAEAGPLVEACLNGELSGSKTGSKFDIRALANPKVAKPLFGISAATGTQSSDAETEQQALINLNTVMPPLGYALQATHPLDTSIPGTFAVIQSEITKGLKRNGVGAAVENVLAPLLREVEEAWSAYQKSAAASMPTLHAVWQRVRSSASVAGYIAQAAAPVLKAPQTGPPAKDMKAFKDEIMKAMRNEVRKGLSRVDGYASGADDEGRSHNPPYENSRAKQAAKKARQSAAKREARDAADKAE